MYKIVQMTTSNRGWGMQTEMAIEAPARAIIQHEREWRPEQIDALKSMWADGAFLSDIGKKLGVSRGAIAGKIHRLKLPKRGRGSERLADDTWTSEATEILKRMWAEGASAPAIAGVVRRSRGAVGTKANRLGLPRRQAPPIKRARPHRHSFQGPRPAVAREKYLGQNYKASSARKTLLELSAGDCRWPCGEPGAADFFFCGAPQSDGRSYCAAHCDIAYVAPVRRAGRAA